jgi:predicted phage terminase large subunit-like protein
MNEAQAKAWQTIKAKALAGNFLAFTKWTKKDYDFNWHHVLMGKKLEQFAHKKVRNIMVFMPPRMGKSELISRRLPAYIFGINPKARIISTSYSADLAQMLNRDVQRIIDAQEYRDIFPNTLLSGENVRTAAQGNWLRNNDIFEIVEHGGVYRCAGVGGGITGMGANYILIDDVVKNQSEADSPTYRQKVWDWYLSTLFTRREKNCSMALVMTRWHEDDLAGRLLKQDADAKKRGEPSMDWEIVKFPMVLESEPTPGDPRNQGEVLWPNKYDLNETMIIKNVTTQNEGARVWNSLYQQEPVAREGSLIKRQWLNKFWREMPARFDEIIQSWDMTFKGGDRSDYVVGQVWGRIGAEKWMLDQARFQGGFTETVAAVKSLSAKWPKAHLKLVEAKANGEAVIDSLKGQVSGIVGISPTDSKEARLNAVSPDFEAGNIILPDPSIAPWVHDYINELVGFPTARHDDCVDASTQAILRFREKSATLAKMTRM